MIEAERLMSKARPLRSAGEPVSIGDAELVAQAIDGDAWAKEILFRRHVRAVMGTVMRLLRDRSDAEDVVQDAFTKAFEELDRLRDRSALRGWLLQIAVHRVYRTLRRRRFLRVLGIERRIEWAMLEELAETSAGPEVRAELALLDRVLAELPLELRVAWTLRHVEGMALEEIAAALSCSLATVKRRIRAADQRVSEHVAKEDRR